MTLSPNTRIGPYEITAAIGAGGMGEVYRARDTKLNRDVAIKVLPAAFADDPERLTRFTREAQTLASLNHPHIAGIYGIEEVPAPSGSTGPESRALVMELVLGEDLSTHLARGPIPVAEALPIARQIAEALEAAHEQGIVHRDLKPANIKVRSDGTVKVLDFGLAKAMDPGGASSSNPIARAEHGRSVSHSPTLTHYGTSAGMIIGTAAYMSPEQAKGKSVDKRTDIWAFGVVLYEMLTGKRAFKGEDVSETLASVLRDTLSMDALPATAPARLRRLIERCLDRDLKTRLRDIGEARIEIARLEAGAPEASMPPSISKSASRPWMIAAVAIVSALLTGLAVWQLNPAPPKQVLRFSLTAAAEVPFVSHVNHNDVAITPDETAIVYNSKAGNDNLLVVRRFDQFEGTAHAASKIGVNARGPFVSPDSQWLGFQTGNPIGTDGQIQKLPLLGGAPVALCDVDGNLRGASWGTNQTIVFATVVPTTGLWSVSSQGGTAEMLTKPAEGEIDHLFPHQLPDGKHVLFSIARPDGSDIGLLSLQTREWRVLIKDGQAPRYLATGHIVYAAGGGIRAIAFDLTRLQTRGAPIEVQAGVLTKESGATDFEVSANGTLVYLTGSTGVESYELFWRDGQGVETSTGISVPSLSNLAVSPDGRFAAATTTQATGLQLIELTRQITTRLPTADLPVGRSLPFWMPDGRQVGFVASGPSDGGAGSLYQVPVTGTLPPERLTTSTTSVSHGTAVWTPDGRHLLFDVFDRTGTHEQRNILRLIPGEGDEPTPLISGAYDPAISPDGRWLAHTSTENSARQVYVRPYPNVNDARIPVFAGTSVSASWSRDGRELFFTTLVGTGGRLMVVQVEDGRTLSLGRPATVMPLRDPMGRSVFVAALSSQRILVARRSGGTAEGSNELRVVLNWGEELKARVP